MWLTTVAKSGQPVPRLVWFFFDGKDVTVYSMPKAAKIAHIKARPQVSLNLDSDGNGRGTVVVAGAARVDAVGADSLADEQYQAKYHDYAVSIGMGDEHLRRVQHAVEDQRRQGVVDAVCWVATTPAGSLPP